jgi:hypothetical protein
LQEVLTVDSVLIDGFELLRDVDPPIVVLPANRLRRLLG